MTAPDHALETTRSTEVGPTSPRGSSFHFVAGAALGATALLPQLRQLSSNLQLFDVTVAAVFVLLIRRGEFTVPPVVRRVVAWGWVFVLALAVSSMRSPSEWAAFTQLVQWVFIFTIVIPTCVALLRFRTARRGAVFGIVAVIAVVAAFALLDATSGTRRFRAYRSTSIYNSPQVAAFQVALAAPILMAVTRYPRLWVRNQSVARLLRAVGAIVLFALVFFLTQNLSRSGAIATLVGLAVFEFGTYFRGGRPRTGHILRFAAVALVLAVAVGAYLDNWAPDNVVTRITSVSTLDSAEVRGRTDGFYDVLEIDPTYYLVGTGPDNYQRISVREIKPHNAFLLMLAEGGIVALFSFAAVFMASLRAMFRAVRRAISPELSVVAIAGTASTCAYLVVAMFNTQAISRGYWFFLSLGIAAAAAAGAAGAARKQGAE